MSNDKVWDDESRENLRDNLRWRIQGEVRLARRSHDDILNFCREVYIQDECPETEQDEFVRFAAGEIGRAESVLEAEKNTWPRETDCDRLDRVESELLERGILLWQVSPCCDSCTRGELTYRIEAIEGRHPGFRDRIRSYAFFIDQNMPDMLSESTDISVYLGYGWLSKDESEVNEEVYATNALSIAQEICQGLRDQGFEVDWNGSLDRKIGISLNWQRRTLLE